MSTRHRLWVFNCVTKNYHFTDYNARSEATFYFDKIKNIFCGMICVDGKYFYTKPFKNELECKRYCVKELDRLVELRNEGKRF